MRSIAEYNKETAVDKLKHLITATWYFETAVDKIVLVAMGILAMWKIAGWIF